MTLSSRAVMKALEKGGWRLRNVKGSHHQFQHPTKPGIVTVPHPKKDFAVKTIRSIEKQSGIKIN